MQSQAVAIRKIQNKLENFESTLENLENDANISDFKYSVTKTGREFSGVLLVESNQGKIFATAVADNINDLSRALMRQISIQTRALRAV